MKFIIPVALLIIHSLALKAQFIDKNISQTIDEQTSMKIEFDADNDGNDDFSFSFTNSLVLSVNILTDTASTAIGTFTANSAKAYIAPCNTLIDQNLSVVWNTSLPPFNSWPEVDQQYCSAFNFDGMAILNINVSTIFHGGFIPVKVNNKFGYILVDFNIPLHKFTVWGSRLQTPEGTGLTSECGTIGIDDVYTHENRFSLLILPDNKCIIKNIFNINDISILDIAGKNVEFDYTPVNGTDHEIYFKDQPLNGVYLVRNTRSNQVERMIRN